MKFGQKIREARTGLGMTQRDLAQRIRKSDGGALSIPYLSDIEVGRKIPPQWLSTALSEQLGISSCYLDYLAGRIPPSIRDFNLSEDDFSECLEAFRGKMMALESKAMARALESKAMARAIALNAWESSRGSEAKENEEGRQAFDSLIKAGIETELHGGRN